MSDKSSEGARRSVVGLGYVDFNLAPNRLGLSKYVELGFEIEDLLHYLLGRNLGYFGRRNRLGRRLFVSRGTGVLLPTIDIVLIDTI